MKLFLKLVFSIALTILAIAGAFSYTQSHLEEKRLQSELEKRSSLLSESLLESIKPMLERGALDQVGRIIDKFSNRERLLGIVLVTSANEFVIASKNLSEKKDALIHEFQEGVQESVKTRLGYGRFLKFEKRFLHGYFVPVMAGDDISQVLIIIYDAGYIHERIMRMWLTGFLRALVQASSVSVIVLLLVYLNILSPIRRTVEWIKGVRRGDDTTSFKTEKMMAPLTKEVSEMVKSLQMARLAAEEEARLRQSLESLWTPERLKEFVRQKLGSRPLVVVSNREPYMHVQKGKEIECIVPASGLVTAIEPVLKACGGTWVAHGAGDADQTTVDAHQRLRVPPEEPQYLLRRVWLSKEEEEGYYYGFANEGIWPLCHVAHTRPMFREGDWEYYKTVNEKFAKAVFEEIKGLDEPCVLIQDYHFALLPGIIKAKRPDARVAIFWHIPWPNPESFGICPWQKDLLRGMLGADIVGFHTQFHCNNFMETVDRVLESRIDYEHFVIHREGQETRVKPFPISISYREDSNGFSKNKTETPLIQALLKPYGIQADFMGVGVDRLDYTKGIVERFRGVESFLLKYPSYHGRFVFVELGAPSRTLIPRYQEFMNEVEKEAERINESLKTKNWKPILFLKKHHSHEEILPFYRAADVCLVTSLHDGMNLVAKEFVANHDADKGVLILSQFTGAARELHDALIINPYDISATAGAIRQALEMPLGEQALRMKEMKKTIRERNIYRWAADIVGELVRVRLDRAP